MTFGGPEEACILGDCGAIDESVETGVTHKNHAGVDERHQRLTTDNFSCATQVFTVGHSQYNVMRINAVDVQIELLNPGSEHLLQALIG